MLTGETGNRKKTDGIVTKITHAHTEYLQKIVLETETVAGDLIYSRETSASVRPLVDQTASMP